MNSPKESANRILPGRDRVPTTQWCWLNSGAGGSGLAIGRALNGIHPRFGWAARAPCPGRPGGYLLLEVLLALAILTILVALVFRIIQTTVRVTTDVQYLQAEQEHADGLYELLRKHFDSIPQTAEFQTRRVKNELELVFLEVPFHFSWTPSGPQFGSTVIAARRQPDGRFTLAVVQEPEDASVSYAASGEPTSARWIPIARGLQECNWRFLDGRTREWKTDWKDPGVKPILFECTFEVGGQNGPTRAVFRWPIAPIQQ
jgi:hypothetical protein